MESQKLFSKIKEQMELESKQEMQEKILRLQACATIELEWKKKN